MQIDRYWPFAALCGILLTVVLRLLVRERITLQGSISYISFLGLFLAAALVPDLTMQLARAMGFTLLSNFLFCLAIIGLALLHLHALVTISRLATRTIHLTQELALLEERTGTAIGHSERGAP